MQIVSKQNDRKQRNNEMYSIHRYQNWNGIRNRSGNNVEGRNWMTYICLKRLNKDIPDDIFVSINEYLNWIPAGCWRLLSDIYIKGCIECGSLFKQYNIINANVCSWRCYESICRKNILKDYNIFVNAISDIITTDFQLIQNYDSIEFMLRDLNYRRYHINLKHKNNKIDYNSFNRCDNISDYV